MKYILDRFEGEYAVLENECGDMHDFPKSLMPEGANPGSILIQDGYNSPFVLDCEATQSRTEHINSLFEKIKNKQ